MESCRIDTFHLDELVILLIKILTRDVLVSTAASKRILFVFFLIFLLFDVSQGFGQSIEHVILGHNTVGENFDDFISRVETNHKLKFTYLSEWFEDKKIQKDYYNATLESALNDLVRGTDLSYIVNYNYYFTFYKDPTADKERKAITESLNASDKLNLKIIGSAENYVYGKSIVLRGKITDVVNKNPIVGATVFVEEHNIGDVTDINGEYSIAIPQGIQTVNVSFVNYETETLKINAISNGTLDIPLFEYALTLQGVTIHSESEDENIASAQVGKDLIKIETIKELPSFMGEVDVVKSILLLPGVSTVGEGASGFNVRGGNVDQNLVTLDGMQVFNYSHLLGFFSAFNPTTVSDITLYKGGIPAEYGQKISSILDVKVKNGATDNFSAEGGIGLISSNLMIEGPILKNKTSFIVAGRSSYSDWVKNRINDIAVRNSSASFYDLNAKVKHTLDEKNNLVFNSYYSHDDFSFANDTTFNWSTGLMSLKFNHIFNPNFHSNFIIGTGSYNYSVDEPQTGQAASLSYGIKYHQLAVGFENTFPKHKLNYGIQTYLYDFQPGEFEPTSSESSVNYYKIDDEKAIENGIYISDEYQLSSKLTVIAGLRLSSYAALGSGDTYLYDPNERRSQENITDTLQFSNNEIIKSYHGLEPRLSMRYLLTPNSSLKIGYNRIFQYIHLISNTTSVSPIDIWQSSNYNIEPQRGDQLSLGYFRNMNNNAYEVSVEGYYKIIDNILEYKNGAELLLNPTLEADLTQGKGRAYGVEGMLKKNKGRLTGWASYTYSISESKINGQFDDEILNGGLYFPSNYNKPHDFSIVANYKLSLRIAFNVNFTYNTGRPITAPISKYSIGDISVNNYSDRNEYRIPDYHRIDIGFTIKTNHKKQKFWEGHWTFAVYNVYGRKNAYSVFFEETANGVPVAKKLSVLGAPFPSISYNFKI